MAQHKWHKEIKAWADGVEIETQNSRDTWLDVKHPAWLEQCNYRIKPQLKDSDYISIAKEHYANLRKYEKKLWEEVCVKVMNDFMDGIKPQPKEPQYLYAWFEPNYGKTYITANTSVHSIPAGYEYLGKIKLESDDAV